MSIHDNHRQRLRQRYLDEGEQALTDQQLLELYLCLAIPRKDVNPLASRLLETFGSLSGVFSAPVEELAAMPGMGLASASAIHLQYDLSQRCARSRRSETEQTITDWRSAGDYLLPWFYGAVTEQLYLLCLDARGNVLRCHCLSRGEATLAPLNLQILTEVARHTNATAVVLAHNHPGGDLTPSQEDLTATYAAEQALAASHVRLLDHLIIADEDFVSIMRLQKGDSL